MVKEAGWGSGSNVTTDELVERSLIAAAEERPIQEGGKHTFRDPRIFTLFDPIWSAVKK